MKITLDEWLELEQLAKASNLALKALDDALTARMFEHHQQGNVPERELLARLSKRAGDAMFDLATSLYYVQSEWTGGPSDEPGNATLREPNWVNIAHSFPPEQVDKYRDEDGEIRLPQRSS